MAICPSCQAENPDGFRFCGACGAPLPAEVRSDRRERRIVSVLFADLVGFTSRSERADVEDVDAFAPASSVLPNGAGDTLTLVTCSGTYLPSLGAYSSRRIVIADAVEF